MAGDESAPPAETPSPPAPPPSLASKAASGVVWTVALTFVARAVSMLVNIIVTRYVTPADYGEVQGAAVLAATAASISSLGLGAYLVAHPKEGQETTWHVTFLGTAGCALLLGILLVFQVPIGHAFKLTDVGHYLPILAAATLIERAGMPMEKLLMRQFRYRPLGIISGIAELMYAASTFLIVVSGYGAIGIAIANLFRTGFKFITFTFLVKRHEWLTVGPLEWKRIERMFRFGIPLTIAGVADFISRRWDNMMTSRYFGAGLMGSYNIAYNLSDIPNEMIAERAGDALLPAFSHLEGERRFWGLVRAMKLLALILYPLAIGLALVADPLVRAVFDERWRAIGPMLSVLCGITLSRPLSYATAIYLQSLSQTHLLPAFEISKTLLMLLLLSILGPIGPTWACGAVVATFTIHTFVILAFVGRRTVSIGALLVAPIRPLLACLPMVAAVLGLRHLVPSLVAGPAWQQLACEIGLGAVVGIASLFVIARAIADDFLGLMGTMLRRRRKA